MKKNILTRVARKFLLMNGYYQLNPYAHASFSQMGEDLIVKKIFNGKEEGFYVDVGAYDPVIYSNTYIFYLLGWRGINIDPSPGCMEKFGKVRPGDINLEIGVALKPGVKTYYQSNEPALNTVSGRRRNEIIKQGKYKIKSEIKIKVTPLRDILKKYLPKGKHIDLMSIDVEGADLEVLRSNDWKLYRPQVIIAESIDASMDNLEQNKIYRYLLSKGYILYGKSNISLIFCSD